MRFLTVIQMADAGAPALQVIGDGPGIFTVGSIRIHGELDTGKPATLSAQAGSSSLFINVWPQAVWPQAARGTSLPAIKGPATLLVETKDGKAVVTLSEDRLPAH